MDKAVFDLIHDLSGNYKLLDFFGIFLAQYLSYILIIVIFVLLIIEKNWRKRLYNFFLISLSVLLARGLAVEVIRFFYQKPRPYIALAFKPLIEMDFSYTFPSGHAAVFFALATAVFFFNSSTPPVLGKVEGLASRKNWSCYFFAGAVLISLARIYVGVHWPLDVLGGAIVGVLSAFIVWKILPRVR